MQEPGIHKRSKGKTGYVVSRWPSFRPSSFCRFRHQRLQNASLVEKPDFGGRLGLWLPDKFERLSGCTVAIEDLQLDTVRGRGRRHIQAAAAVAGDELEEAVAHGNRLP